MSLDLLSVYKSAFKYRYIDLLISREYSKGFIRCPTHLSIGQELFPSLLNEFSDNSDFAVSTHRSHYHYFSKGGSLPCFFDELHGLNSGCSGGNGGSMHLIDESVGFMGSTAIVGNTIPIGVGLSNSQKISESENLTYILLGDGATEEGVFYESLHYASLFSLPIIFVVENNNYSVYTNLEDRQSSISLQNKTTAFNVSYMFNDRHDYRLLYNQIQDARQHALSSGPVLIEVMTFRCLEHCGPNVDDHLNYRPPEYIEFWNSCDYLDMLERDIMSLFPNLNILDFQQVISSRVDELYLISLNKRQALDHAN